METTCVAEKDLTAELDKAILEIQHLAFPKTMEFVSQRWWHSPAAPEDLWFVCLQDGRLIGSVRLIHRRIQTPAGGLLAGGIANVCSHPQARGHGAASACMRASQQYMAKGADFGLLFCGQKVHEFYRKLGWQDVQNELSLTYLDGRQGKKQEGHIMIYLGRRAVADWPAGEIDINGPDW